jgi:hypothetical protein
MPGRFYQLRVGLDLAPHQRFELLRGQWHRIGPMWKRMGHGG